MKKTIKEILEALALSLSGSTVLVLMIFLILFVCGELPM